MAGDRVEVPRNDRRAGGVGYAGKRDPLWKEATLAVELWYNLQSISKEVLRIAPEQRSSVDDALDAMLEPNQLLCESNPITIRERMKRKYVYHGPLGRHIINRPVIWVNETWREPGDPSPTYTLAKHEEAWMELVKQMRRRVLCGELLPAEGEKYWMHSLVGPTQAKRHGKEVHVYEVFGQKYIVSPHEDEKRMVVRQIMAKQKRLSFGSQSAPRVLYAPDQQQEDNAAEPPMESEFLRDDRAAQIADFYEYLNSFQWFHCRDGCRRRFYYTRMDLPSRRVPAYPGERADDDDDEGVRERERAR